MGKRMFGRRIDNRDAKAILRNARVSVQKLNLIAQMIRGQRANNALATLAFSKRQIARDVRKLLESAIANAENNHQLDVDRLFVKEAFVGKSITIKRFRPRARGLLGRIKRPFSHMTVILSERREQTNGS
ncbi:Ribosomal protein L22 [Candidatus Endolissoclinum faulkneri L2]|uniref:Large ribosomal subunit protein uL22 n=1 Tax=Candidatus Endolissoclinum faulkneri L2 TaxID=1193729 RepID=K7Z3B1_9PROT|nr:50S ribosomal protein L22 [Candidatus Endolissoclinum faulkneri]AFX98433.1 Ribosomal protein L22 [Candidatus Endolissoclinum faulkneri L2]